MWLIEREESYSIKLLNEISFLEFYDYWLCPKNCAHQALLLFKELLVQESENDGNVANGQVFIDCYSFCSLGVLLFL